MAWQTPKTNWTSSPDDAPVADDFNRIEGNIAVVREQDHLPINFEVVSSFPAHKAGRAVYHTGNKRAYVSTGSAWIDISGVVGNAALADVLSGKTFSSEVAGVGVAGTMPNRGAVVITPGQSQQAIQAGYHSGSGYVKAGMIKITASTSQPPSPNLYDIWVVATLSITNVIFSLLEPPTHPTGTLWVKDSIFTDHVIDVIYPQDAKALYRLARPAAAFWTGSAWQEIDDLRYWNGTSWQRIFWPRFLYDEGREWHVSWVAGYSLGSGSVSKQSDHMYLDAYGEGGQYTAERAYVINSVVDLTEVSKLLVDWSNSGTSVSTNESYLVASTNKTGAAATYDARYRRTSTFSRQVDELDVSTLSGNYYVRVHARDAATGTYQRSTLRVYRVWGE